MFGNKLTMIMNTVTPVVTPARCLYRILIGSRPSFSPVYHPWRTPYIPGRSINRSAGASGLQGLPKTAYNDPEHPLDEKIKGRMVHLANDTGSMQEAQMLSYLLKQITRSEEHLQQVGTHSQTGNPVVRVRTKRWFREQEQVKDAQKKAQTRREAGTKELELTWGIEKNNDLEHRMNKMQVWLEEGKNVEVVLGQKRGGRKASEDDARDLVKTIRDRVSAVDGAHETTAMEGALCGQAILKFQGKQGEKGEKMSTSQALRRDRLDKMKKKEEEKARQKAKAEEKMRKAKEREEEKMKRFQQMSTAAG